MISATAQFPLLSKIETPDQLRKLNETQLPQLVDELREFLIQTLNQCGGHFAANLGTVELTVVLHYLFNTPNDRLIWDVGHQAYAHKILTGRRNKIHTIRKISGLAPFPSRDESLFDSFGVGHSSSSISASLGMAIASTQQKITRKTIAVIGDGAMTAGMAFEALNHAGALNSNVLVILNDNEMSISGNVGALSNYFARILSGKFYTTVRMGSKKILKALPAVHELARRTEEHLKGMLIPGTLFEELGFNYIGPISGHDLHTLISTLRNVRTLLGPQLVHVVTRKGKGFVAAEQDPIKYHAVMPGFLTTPLPVKKLKTYSNVFGDWICDMAQRDQRLVAITPAMREGSDLVEFSKRYPDRYFDVGIAEQHAVTLAAGLACEGLKPIVAIYSTFLQRAYDQLIHDVALQKLPVLFAIDRAGIVGGDGATHHGNFDLAYLRCIPNLIIMAPGDENELRHMLYTAFSQNLPCAIRYPRGVGFGIEIEKPMHLLPLGKAQIRRQGKDIAILAFGSMLKQALQVGDALDATVINMRFIKPLDTELLDQLIKTHHYLVTLEEHMIAGGAGSSIGEYFMHTGQQTWLIPLGLPDQFIPHGDPEQLLQQLALDSQSILATIKQEIRSRS